MDPAAVTQLVFFALIIVAMYFLLIRPQRRRQQQHLSMIRNLKVGDDVVTIGGLHGRVDALLDDAVDLEVTDDVVLRFQMQAIAKVVSQQPAERDEQATRS